MILRTTHMQRYELFCYQSIRNVAAYDEWSISMYEWHYVRDGRLEII